jgi:hypothetical protein
VTSLGGPDGESAIETSVAAPPADRAPGALPPLVFSLLRSTSGVADILDNGSVIRPGDQLFLNVAPQRDLHLYVLNQDLTGELFVLFPLDGVPPGNPLVAGNSYRLPGTRDGVPLDWRVTSAGGTESFLFIASERQLVDLEAELRSITAASLGHPSAAGNEGDVGDGVVLRGVGGLSVARKGVGPSADRLDDLTKRLEQLRDEGKPVWVERIDLENP